jgi:DNA repair protein RadC
METIYEIQRIRQVVMEETSDKNIVRTPEDGAEIARKFIGDDDREIFFVMCLNTKNKVVAVHRAHVGSLNASLVRPADVFKAAILNNSASIIVCHQHPSGQPTPSHQDIEVTQRLVETGKLIDIAVLDHLIIGGSNFISLKEAGHI